MNKMKRQLTEWEKIFANGAIHRSLIPKYTNSSYNSRANKTNKPIEKWQKT